jgi:transcriptional regulator with XRE-family HTH domain
MSTNVDILARTRVIMLRRRIGTMQDLMNIARARRMELGLSEADLAARIVASRAWVNSFERGKRTVELAIVFRLFEALGIAVEVTDAADLPTPQPAEPDLDELLKGYER